MISIQSPMPPKRDAQPSNRLGGAASLLFAAIFSVGAQSADAAPLLLFGGTGHKTFLGCLNCSKYDSGSVCNKYGEHGSKYAADSIWNKYGNFGSKYSSESPWNKYASEPPVIVDEAGNFYGYLTANSFNPKRTRIKVLVILTDAADTVAEDPEAAADAFCSRE